MGEAGLLRAKAPDGPLRTDRKPCWPASTPCWGGSGCARFFVPASGAAAAPLPPAAVAPYANPANGLPLIATRRASAPYRQGVCDPSVGRLSCTSGPAARALSS